MTTPPPADTPPRFHQSVAIKLLLAAAGLWCLYWFVHAWPYWEDDAYIHLEFARSLAAGQGFAFNGRIVAGDTAPLWVFLLAGLHTLIPDWLVAGKVLTVLGAGLGLSGFYAFARSLVWSRTQPPGAAIFPAAMVLLIVVNPYFCYWAFSGMEPVAAAGLACWAVLVATHPRPSTGTFLTGCLLAGIAPLLRPEMIFLSALLVLPLFSQWRRPFSPTGSPARSGIAAAGALLLALPQTLWSLYSLHAFGHLLPNTNAAKRAAPSDSVVHRLLAVYASAFPLILCGLLAGIVYLALRPSAVRDSLRAAVDSALGRTPDDSPSPGSSSLAGWIFLLWAAITTVFYIANHTYVQTRYILVTAPGLTIVVMLLALRASRRTGRVLYVAALLAGAVISAVTVRPFLRNKGIDCQLSRDLALFMRDHIPPSAPVAVYAIGEIAFVSQHPIVDTGGITRPGAIPYLNDPDNARMVQWARSQGSEYYIAGSEPEPGAQAVYTIDQRFVGWTIHTSLYSTAGAISLWKLPSAQQLDAQRMVR